MAIIRGTSRSVYPSFDDPSSGVGALLDVADNTVKSVLGGFSKYGSFEDSFHEDGVQNIPGFTTVDKSYGQVKDPISRRILTQRPQSPVFVKKRMFSTLRSNYDVRFLDETEKVFFRAAKKLFEKKAADLSFYESLINVGSVIDSDGFLISDQVTDVTLSSLINLIENTFQGVDLLLGKKNTILELVNNLPELQPFKDIVEELIKLNERNQRSKGSTFTTWVVDPHNPDVTGLGPGVGVIELTRINDWSVNVGLDGNGNARLNIEDPYRVCLISDLDIEIALREAIAEGNNPSASFKEVSSYLLRRSEILDERLNIARRERDLSKINFEYLSLADNSKLGTIDLVGITFVTLGKTYSIFELDQVPSEQALNSRERALVEQIVELMAAYQTAENRSIGLFQTINEKYNSVRQRLRNEFVGHTIIQQMDTIHIFMNSNTRDDTAKTNSGFDYSIVSGNLQLQGDYLDVNTVHTEWKEIAPKIPFALYLSMRDRTVFRGDGVQVFSGVVDSVGTSYRASNGKFNISVACKDNTEFLKLGRITINPTLTQQKGSLHDPLTPFELKTDPATGLISSAPELSSENRQRLKYLRFDDGLLAGKRASENNIFQNALIGGKVKTYQHLPGLVYRWKNGIISETLNVNLRKPLDGSGSTISDVAEVYGITVLDNPFAGLDSADVISILVSGRPHNYSTFLKHTIDVGTYSIDNTNNRSQYFNYLFDFLERQDHIHGNFFPLKSDIIDPVAAIQAYREQKKLTQLNVRLNTARKNLADVEAKIKSGFGNVDASVTLRNNAEKLSAELDDAVKNARDAINSGDNKNQVTLNVIGNSVHLEFTSDDVKDISRKIKYQQKKKVEDVRYNLDRNYLVISEQYDSDVDIQAFARRLKSTPANLFNTEFKSPWELCQDAARTVGFELFADSQGNIVFRPPQYNKTPLSLLIRLLNQQKTEGASWAPQFLKELFGTRSGAIEERILLLELMILEKVILLGYASIDEVVSTGIGGSVTLSIERVDSGGPPAPNRGQTWVINFNKLKDQETRDTLLSAGEQEALRSGDFDTAIETSELAYDLISVRNSIYELQGRLDLVADMSSSTDLEKAAADIQKNRLSDKGDPNAPTNRFKLINDIAQLISERKIVGKAYYKMQENLREFEVKDAQSSRGELIVPSAVVAQLKGLGGSDMPVFPKFMEPLIENDLSHEDGFRSGNRFIVKDDVIISMDLEVKTPDFNLVEVNGNQDFVGGNPGEIASLPILWAGAVDFDSWRQFGFRPMQTIHRPDFTSAELQSAPYALFKLYEERRKIHSGTITVLGNENYQVGDVIYLNNRSMLYYVSSVQHSHNYSNASFQTTLALSYGRALGEYIPTPLDVIGKSMLASAKNAYSGYKANRSTVGSSHAVHLESMYVEDYLNIDDSFPDVIQKKRDAFLQSKQNQDSAKRAIKKAASKINTDIQGDSKIEIRTFYISGENEVDTKKRALMLSEWAHTILTQEQPEKEGQAAVSEILFDRSKIVIVPPIDIHPDSEIDERQEKLRRFPSAQAWAGTKIIVEDDGIPLPLNAIDIVFVFEKSRFGDQPPLELSEVNASDQTAEAFDALSSDQNLVLV